MLRISPMTTADLDAVMTIELDSHPEPWSIKSFLEELAQPCSRILTARIPERFFIDPADFKKEWRLSGRAVELNLDKEEKPLPGVIELGVVEREKQLPDFAPGAGEEKIALRDERIAGYICFWFVADEVQILNVAVAKVLRGQGIGRSLLGCALDLARERESRVAVLEVRPSNTAARRLYESMGFKAVGMRPNYYAGQKEPAILMELALSDDGQREI